MAGTYSTYEAKARFSELLRKVRSGETVYVSYRGKPVAEIRPIEETESMLQKLERLEAQGVVSRATDRRRELRPIARRPGGLERFLGSRD